MILGTRNLIIPGMVDIWSKSSPAMINLFAGPPLSEDDLRVLARDPEVAIIEGANNTTIEWRLNEQDDWKTAALYARIDYNNQKLNKLELISGPWPHDKTMSVDQDSDTSHGMPMGGEVQIRVNEREEWVKVGGEVYNNLIQPAFLGGNANFYTEQENYERPGGRRRLRHGTDPSSGVG